MIAKRKRWVLWVGLVFMLLAIACYVMSFDESDPDMVPHAVETVKDGS